MGFELIGVKHSSLRAAQSRRWGAVSKMTSGSVCAARRFQRGDGVRFAPQRIVADRVAAVELSHAVEFVIVRRAALGVSGRRPAGAADGTHRQRPELVEGETPLRVVFGDAVQPSRSGSFDSFHVLVRS